MKTTRLLRQRGLTLIELMVSMVLMLLVTLATVGLYSVSSGSYRTVDSSQQLQDSARFAMEVISQAARTAGYQDRTGSLDSVLTDKVFGPTTIETWRVQGKDDAQLGGGSSITYGSSNGVNRSDALVLRFFGTSSATSSTTPDGSIIDCSGRSIPYPTGSADVGVSAFFVKTVNGEPELACLSYNTATGTYSTSQVVRGVETFQVMYGLDTDGDEIPNRWLSAATAWDDAAANPNWNKIVAIRVGMVLRGAVGSGQGQSATASDNILYPLGKTFIAASTEAGLTFTPPDDGRLRRVFSSTFMLRNPVL